MWGSKFFFLCCCRNPMKPNNTKRVSKPPMPFWKSFQIMEVCFFGTCFCMLLLRACLVSRGVIWNHDDTMILLKFQSVASVKIVVVWHNYAKLTTNSNMHLSWIFYFFVISWNNTKHLSCFTQALLSPYFNYHVSLGVFLIYVSVPPSGW